MSVNILLSDSGNIVHLQNFEGQLFECPVEVFRQYEPEYPVLAAPFISRQWTEAVQSVSDGFSQRSDPAFSWPKFQKYLRKILSYQAAYDAAHPVSDIPEPPEPEPPTVPTIYASLIFSGGDGEPIPGIYPNDADPALQCIKVLGKILLDPDDDTSILPITYKWRIPIFQVAHEKFTHDTEYTPIILDSFPFKIQITGGIMALTYTRKHEGIYMISDIGFEFVDGVKFGQEGQWQVKLINGPKFFKVIE